MKIKENIPNAITCSNLLCGSVAIIKIFENDLALASCFVGLAVIFDFMDGFAARMLKVSSPIGKDLDSLADMVTFGVVPGMMMFQLFSMQQINSQETELDFERIPYLKYISFLITIFSAIRLAKFNNDVRQNNSFIGLATPANTIFICSIPLIIKFQPDLFLENPRVGLILLSNAGLTLIVIISSFLLVSKLPLFALKFASFGWNGNQIRYVFLCLSLLMLVFLQFVGIPLIIILYVLLSILNNLTKKT